MIEPTVEQRVIPRILEQRVVNESPIITVPLRRITDAPGIMKTLNPTAKRTLKTTPRLHRRVTRNNMPGILPVPLIGEKSYDILPVPVLIRDNSRRHLAIPAPRQTRAQAAANGTQMYTHLPSQANRRIITRTAEIASTSAEHNICNLTAERQNGRTANLTAERQNDGTAERQNGGPAERRTGRTADRQNGGLTKRRDRGMADRREDRTANWRVR